MEVPAALLLHEAWHVCFLGKWRGSLDILRGEGRAAIMCARHALRSAHELGRRHTVLCDNLPLVLALSKGRANSLHLLQTCRELCALSLFSSTEFHFRWVPSELDPADAPSRISIRHHVHATSPLHSISETALQHAIEVAAREPKKNNDLDDVATTIGGDTDIELDMPGDFIDSDHDGNDGRTRSMARPRERCQAARRSAGTTDNTLRDYTCRMQKFQIWDGRRVGRCRSPESQASCRELIGRSRAGALCPCRREHRCRGSR